MNDDAAVSSVIMFCQSKLEETLKDSYPSYQEFRMAEVDLWTEKRMVVKILDIIDGKE